MKKYLVNLELFIYAEDKAEAVDKALQISKIIDNIGKLSDSKRLSFRDSDFLKDINDNKCEVIDVLEINRS